MKIYNRNGILYIRINGVRKSTKLNDTPQNRKLITSFHKNDEFFKNIGIKKDVPLFIDICQEVLDEKVVKNTSYASYVSMYKSKIIPFFSKKKVNEIKPKNILDFYNSFTDSSSLNTCIAILRPAFKKAVINEYLEVSPLNGVDKPKFKKTHCVKPFNFDDIEKILSVDSNIKNLLGVLFYTGMRIGEAIGLKWSDLDFNRYEISISRTITKGFIQTPKTVSSIRTIDMLPQCEHFLNLQRLKTGLSEYVFLSLNNKHYKGSFSLIHEWKKILKSVNIEYRVLYQTRHTFASNMLSNGEDLMWVSATLGHRSPNVTLDKYSRYIRVKKDRKTTFLDSNLTHLA